jgi:hypothetical protein
VRTAALLFCTLCLATATAVVSGQEANPEFTDLSGALQHPMQAQGKAGSVLIFYWHDCPICNSYVPEINRLRSQFTDFVFYTIEIDPDWTVAAARTHVHEFGLRAPFLLDGCHLLVALASATVAPEAVVIGKNKTVLYRGRIDNAYAGLNQRRPAATVHDLRDALAEIAAGKAVTNQPPPVGCLIPDTRRRK